MSSIIACGVSEPRKNQRRGSMMECARKKKINYFGVKKVDQKIVDMLTGKSKNKIYTLNEATGSALGIASRAKKVHGWIVQHKDNKKKIEKVKEWEKELEVLKTRYKNMVQIVEQLKKEDKKLKEEMQKIKEANEKEKAKKEEAKRKKKEEKEEKKRNSKKKNSKSK